MGIRDRKQQLINMMKFRAKVAKLDAADVAVFEMLYRHARTQDDQDQVTRAFDLKIDGWKTNKDAFSVVRRGFLDDEDEDEDLLELVAALERKRASV